MRASSPFLLSLILAGLLGLWSCGGPAPVVYKSSRVGQVKVCRVAVLPFSNETRYPVGGLLVYRVFQAELVATRIYEVVSEGDVRKLLIQYRILPGDTPGGEFYEALVKYLGVDAVVEGRVIQMDEVQTEGEVEPRLAFWVKLRDARTRKVLMTAYNSRKGGDYRKVMHFGVVGSLTELAKRMCDEILVKWRKEGLRGCGD